MPISFDEAGRRLGAFTADLGGGGSERALVSAGVAANRAMATAARVDTGGDGRLSGFGRGAWRGRIAAQSGFDTQPGLRIVVYPKKKARGLWGLLQFGSKGTDWTYPRRRGRRRRAGSYSRRSVQPRRTWSQAQPVAARAAFDAYRTVIVKNAIAKLGGR